MKNIHLRNFIIDSFRKRKVFETALKNGCDPDSDIVIYKNVVYCVHLMIGYMCRSTFQVDSKVRKEI